MSTLLRAYNYDLLRYEIYLLLTTSYSNLLAMQLVSWLLISIHAMPHGGS